MHARYVDRNPWRQGAFIEDETERYCVILLTARDVRTYEQNLAVIYADRALLGMRFVPAGMRLLKGKDPL